MKMKMMKMEKGRSLVIVIQLMELLVVTKVCMGNKVRTTEGGAVGSKSLSSTTAGGRGGGVLISLSNNYYINTCPDAEGIIQQKMSAWFKKDHTLAPSIIRLHFHDCVVRGCDASILLNHNGSERAARVSKTLRGFQVIDDIKSQLERRCPRTVSCADILTAAARDATGLLGGPFWEVPFGRKDGTVSIAKEAEDTVPQGHENITALINLFQDKLGLSVLDLVTLSGAHTVGRSTCGPVLSRLGRRVDPTHQNATYMRNLTRACKGNKFPDRSYVNLDVETPRVFDSKYYTNLGNNMGLLSTDQELYSDPRTTPYVSVLGSQPQIFFSQFSVSMTNLGNIIGISTSTASHSQVRINCNFVNPV